MRVIIAGMQLPQTSVDDSLTAFGLMYAELARRNSAELDFIPSRGRGGQSGLQFAGPLHPNARGQAQILATNVWPVLERP